MKILKDFKEFSMRGNVIDLAVGVVIGTAFGKIVSSLVSDIIMPLLGGVTSKLDFKHLQFTLVETHGNNPSVVISYGNFLQTIMDFIIIAFSIFMMVSLLNKLKKTEEISSEPSAQEKLLTEIRDILKEKNL